MSTEARNPLPLVLAAAVIALVLAAWLASGASARLVSPPPRSIMMAGILAWLAFGTFVAVVLGGVTMPRLVRRLTVLGCLAASGWALGTIGRATYATIAFALATSIDEVPSPWRAFQPGGGASVTVSSFEHRRSLKVDADAAAAAEISRHPMCLTLTLQRTQSGAVRVRQPERPLTLADLVPCPAVQRLR